MDPRGVDLLVQLRMRVLDGTLDSDLKHWREQQQKPENAFKLAA
jgi:hypothetical protein